MAKRRQKKTKLVRATGIGNTVLRRVLMAGMKWVRKELDDEEFGEVIKQAAAELGKAKS